MHSPGIVDDLERLARLVFEPKHLAADGTIEVGALRDVSGNGLSLQRRREGDGSSLVGRGNRMADEMNERSRVKAVQVDQPPVQHDRFIGIVELVAGAVRKHQAAGRRAFCVMDSAEADDSLHADIILNGRWSKTARSKLRNELRQLIVALSLARISHTDE